MKRCGAVLLCAAVLAGCAADNASWLMRDGQAYRRAMREHAAQWRTTDRLLAAYRECLATGEAEALCWVNLAAYRDCIEADGSDAVCQGD